MRKIYLLLSFLTLIGFAKAQQNLIPYPVQVNWEKGALSLRKGLIVKGEVLPSEKIILSAIAEEWRLKESTHSTNVPVLEIIKEPVLSTKKGAYELEINAKGILIKAADEVGISYGLQTLRQFEQKNGKIPYCKIKDEPAFSWRAFLVDVGRNFQPMDLLKEQIDVMARYKLNVLHFHFTEDIAWRLASKKYPGLTDAAVMTRWKGQYYSEKNFKELIQYCAERHITLLPEIDMPGHSAAFRRFFGVDMQSDSGMMYIKELLREFKETYPSLEQIHIGGDEVKITNKNFMPEITKFVEQLGFKVTHGWTPGSNLEPQTIRQMWMGGPKLVEEKGDFVFIESKHLYINHMDPLETVTTLFHRKAAELDREHKNMIGATLCSWPDRAVAKPIDMFYHSAIYPAILTFAERIWQGGGRNGWIANIVPSEDVDYASFVDFEKRLLAHKNKYFQDKPFPYVSQLGTKWDLIGPYDNQGNVQKIFEIEKNPFASDIKVEQVIEGGTVILKHWFGNIIQPALNNPKPNTTYYARTKIWADKNQIKSFWIGFNNHSRSYLTDTPELGTWDNKGSKAFVNGKEIEPPHWQNAGQLGASEVPLVDEGYSYREPTRIPLKKGWNEVLLKLPVAGFSGRTWDNPSKWMFTFVQID